MSKNEKIYVLENYISNAKVRLQLFCNKSKGINIYAKFLNSKVFNRPDMYYYNKRYCYIFEHFEVDASLYRKGKGSFYKRNISIADKQLENETNNLIRNSKIDKNEISALGTTSITTTQEAKLLYHKSSRLAIGYF